MSSKEDILDTNHENSHSETQPSECDLDFFGPALPPHLLKKNILTINRKENEYGSAILENLCDTEKDESVHDVSVSKGDAKTLIGPEIPKFLQSNEPSSEAEKEEAQEHIDDIFGPSTSLMATEQAANTYYTNNSLPKLNKQNLCDSSAKRETWMIELPEKKKNFALGPRQFSSRIHTEKESDDSIWTDTPEDKKRKESHGKKKDHKEILKLKRLKERDKEMEKLARKAAKSLRKKESLLEMHLKSMKKKKKKERKKREKEGNAVPERRPFDRNVDLQIRKFDESQKRAILNKSQFLNDRFAAGQSRFL